MLGHFIDHDHLKAGGARLRRYSRLDRIKSGEGSHPSVRQLVRRPRATAASGGARVKQFLRIARGYMA